MNGVSQEERSSGQGHRVKVKVKVTSCLCILFAGGRPSNERQSCFMMLMHDVDASCLSYCACVLVDRVLLHQTEYR